MIFSGMQHAISFIAWVLADAGDSAMVEDPGYRLARQAFQFAGLKVVPVPVDEHGFDVSAACGQTCGVQFIYTTPAHQMPLGMTMPLSRRVELLRWAAEKGIWIVEDDYDGEFRFSGSPLPALQSLDMFGRVIYAGTFSKMLFPSLRLAFLVLPPELVEPFAAARCIADRYTPVLEQVVLFRFLADGHFARHARRMRAVYAERYEALFRACSERVGEHIRIQPAVTGMQTPAYLINHKDDRRLADQALATGIEVIPLSNYYAEAAPRPGFLLGFGTVDARAMMAAAETLRRILE
jgi:GntR family transcriptional regulator/MocR family aminotransferase